VVMKKSVKAILDQLDPNEAFRQIMQHEDLDAVWDLIGPLLQHQLKTRPLCWVLAYTFIEAFEWGALKHTQWYNHDWKTSAGGWPDRLLEDLGLQDKKPEAEVLATKVIHDHPPVPRDLLTPEQAADYLQVSLQTLAGWRAKSNQNKLSFVKCGRAIRYRRSDLIEWLSKQKVTKAMRSEVADGAAKSRRMGI
jgi:excisionase family DNA binding protein